MTNIEIEQAGDRSRTLLRLSYLGRDSVAALIGGEGLKHVRQDDAQNCDRNHQLEQRETSLIKSSVAKGHY